MNALAASAVLLLALAAPSRAAGSQTVLQLRDAFVESVNPDKKKAALAELARLPPDDARDLQALFDLFMRFPEEAVRNAALSSLELANPGNPQFDPLVTRYLRDEDLEGVLFALKAAARLRPPSALALVRDIAEKRFQESDPQSLAIVTERNRWWVQYEALSTLAAWEGEKALPLLLKKCDQAPAAARLLGLHFWRQALPQIERWSRGSARNRAKALHALKAPVPHPDLRATRGEMLRHLRDPKAPKDLRHQLALKLGRSSTAEEIAELLREYDALTDKGARLYYQAALFSSLDPQVIPLLRKTALESKDPRARAGAVAQLQGMLPAPEARTLLETVLAKDSDPENRREFSDQLKALATP